MSESKPEKPHFALVADKLTEKEALDLSRILVNGIGVTPAPTGSFRNKDGTWTVEALVG